MPFRLLINFHEYDHDGINQLVLNQLKLYDANPSG